MRNTYQASEGGDDTRIERGKLLSKCDEGHLVRLQLEDGRTFSLLHIYELVLQRQ